MFSTPHGYYARESSTARANQALAFVDYGSYSWPSVSTMLIWPLHYFGD